ncbi:MAG: hypothetical protein ACYS0K_23390 [Planctomycetota bacterium]
MRTQEAKMRAAFRVLLDMPEASVKEVVEEFVRRIQDRKAEEVAKSFQNKMDAAMKAAEKAG